MPYSVFKSYYSVKTQTFSVDISKRAELASLRNLLKCKFLVTGNITQSSEVQEPEFDSQQHVSLLELSSTTSLASKFELSSLVY